MRRINASLGRESQLSKTWFSAEIKIHYSLRISTAEYVLNLPTDAAKTRWIKMAPPLYNVHNTQWEQSLIISETFGDFSPQTFGDKRMFSDIDENFKITEI